MFAPALLALAAISVPILLTCPLACAGVVLHQGFALVCHQRPERCFWIFGAPIAVCTRCLGIYLGAAIGLVLRSSRRIALQLLIAAAALNSLDWLTEAAGLHGNRMFCRFALGVFLGTAAALVISSALPLLSHRLDSTN